MGGVQNTALRSLPSANTVLNRPLFPGHFFEWISVCFLSSLLPVSVVFDNGFVGFARVAIVADGPVMHIAFRSADRLQVRQLHVFCPLDELAQFFSLRLDRLVHGVLFQLVNANVLSDCAVIARLNRHNHEHGETSLQCVLLASCSEGVSAEVLNQGRDEASADGDTHEARGELVALVVANEDAFEAELKASTHIELAVVELGPVWLAHISELHKPLVRLGVLLRPLLGTELFFEEVRVENDGRREQVGKVGGLSRLSAHQVIVE
mmetsp:Transcript_21754/g.26820  ORF Transcript_21754/g.26820 Transcript_21754/m.26820 type:complete len:265 (+) Transcript_21754:184-978(+)